MMRDRLVRRASVPVVVVLMLLSFAAAARAEKPSIYNYPLDKLQKQIERAQKPVDIPGYPPSQEKVPANPKWLGSDMGKADVVLPPWTPVKVDGRTVLIWGREYRFAPSGLPAQMISKGKKILAGPVSVHTVIDGKAVKYQPASSDIKTASDTKAVIESKGQAGSLGFELKTKVSYDGYARFDLTVTPHDRAKVDQLILEIPVRSERAKLFSKGGLGTRRFSKKKNHNLFSQYAHGGVVPEQGVKLPFTAEFILSDYERGIAWACQTERGWSVKDRQSMTELVKKGDRTVLRIHWIDKPTKLGEPLHLAWGLTALPVRPLADWQRYRTFYTFQSASAANAWSRIHGDIYRGQGHPAWAKPDANKRAGQGGQDDEGRSQSADSSTQPPRDRLALAKKHGLKVIIVHQMWTELQGYPGTYRKKNAHALRRLVQEAHQRGLKVVLYLGSEVTTAAPLWDRFGAKMIKMPLDGGKGRKDPKARAWRPGCNPYYNDFLVYKTREVIRKYDIDGLFLDGHPGADLCMNPLHGHGYTVDGRWRRGIYTLHDTRQLMKRLYTLFHHAPKKDGIIIGHSGGVFQPPYAYTDFMLMGEGQAYYHRLHPNVTLMELLSPTRFAAGHNPYVTGIPVTPMSKPAKGGFTAEQDSAVTLLFRALPRSQYPELLSHVKPLWRYSAKLWRVFDAYGPQNAVWHPYWSNGDLVKPGSSKVKISFYARKGRDLLAVVSNPTDKPVKGAVQWDLKALGLGSGSGNKSRMIARDAMTGEHLSLDDDGVLHVKLAPEAPRLVLITRHSDEMSRFTALWRDAQAAPPAKAQSK